MTHARLPIHGQCHHATDDCDQAQRALTDVWAALNRAGHSGPGTTAAELVDQLAAQRDRARSALADAQELIATLDDTVERIDRARARYATRPGSPAGSAQDDVGTLIRYCVYPGCRRSYRADVGPSDRGWMRLRGLAVLCPDHSTAAGSAQDTAPPAESQVQPPIGMQQFLDYSTAEWRAARTADERVEVIRDLLEGWYDRWDAHYPGAVTDEHDGIARHLVALITAGSRSVDREG